MAGVKGKSGLKPGKTNNPNGRVKGSKNKIRFDVKLKLAEGVDETFIKSIFTDVESIPNKKDKVMAKIKIVEMFVPKPKDPEDADKENEFRNEFMKRLFNEK